MQYVAAEWVDDGAGGQVIKATGDDGSEWWIPSIDCDVPPWPEFLASEAGREFQASSPQPKEGEP